MTTRGPLIEHYLPIDEISVEAIRERSAASALPPINWLHVWWARRPLALSRAAIAASLLPADVSRDAILSVLGTSSTLMTEHHAIEKAKADETRADEGYSTKRAFTHNPTPGEQASLRLICDNPLVLDVTAGGGSIPFEAGRLGLRSIANELNPVAAFILRATCQWPQQHGPTLRRHYGRKHRDDSSDDGPVEFYDGIAGRFLARVNELMTGVYPPEPQNSPEKTEISAKTPKSKKISRARAKRYVWSYLFARALECPSCNGVIPLSPNWRLDSKGSGIRLIPDTATRTCSFQVVDSAAEQSPGTIARAIAVCPFPDCRASTPKGYVARQAQAKKLGHQLYCIIWREQWHTKTKAGKWSKRPKTRRGFRAPTASDHNSPEMEQRLEELSAVWAPDNILPTEEIYVGDKTNTPIDYGMPYWRDMFSPRQLLAHGYCVQAFRELVEEDRAADVLDETRRAAWGYMALALDKLINRNSLITRWDSGKNIVVGTFDSHDFGMKWSYSEMAIVAEGLGLEWAIDDIGDCIDELVKMCGHDAGSDTSQPRLEDPACQTAPPTKVVNGPAQFMFSVPDGSVDCVVFDPPYHNNVNYAELSDYFYVWLKRTAGCVMPELFPDYLTDKVNEAIASPARFRQQVSAAKQANPRAKVSAARLATEDYLAKMSSIFVECRRVIKPADQGGIMTVMFTHKELSAWDALITALIEAEFNITRVWPIKTEAESSLNIMDKAAARTTMLLVCRPRDKEQARQQPRPWPEVEREIGLAVQQEIPRLASYNFKPVDIYNAAYGPALKVISENWGARRMTPHMDRLADDDPFRVTPTDALEVARREVTRWRMAEISRTWADSHPDTATAFYILSQDGVGAATMPFDEANLFAKAIGMDFNQPYARRIAGKKGDKVTLASAKQRLARADIDAAKAPATALDQVHTAIALTERAGNSEEGQRWLDWNGINPESPGFKGALESLLTVLKPHHDDHRAGHALYQKLYSRPHRPQGEQIEFDGITGAVRQD